MRRGEFEDPRLVEVYDAETPWGWDDDFFMAVLAERSAPRVLALGCGTGRLAIAMAEAGHDVTGVDPGGPALDAARRKAGAERVRWVHGAAVPGGQYDTVLLADHVAHRIAGDQEWSAMLRAARRSLREGGRLILVSRDPDRWAHGEEQRTVVLSDGVQVLVRTTTGDKGAVADHYAFPDGTRLTVTATLRLRTERELRSSVEAAGFDVDRVYGGWSREPVGLSDDGELILLAVARPRPRRR